MHPTLSTHTTEAQSNHTHLPLSLPLPGTAKKPHYDSSTLDSLLRTAPAQQIAPSYEADLGAQQSPGLFVGLRVALLFNGALALAGILGYEAWAMLAR